MKTLYSVLILIIYAFSELDQASSNDPLLVLKTYSFFTPGRVTFPSKAEELNGEIIYPEIEPEEKSQDEENQGEEHRDKKNESVKDHLYLCHPLSPTTRKILEESSEYYPQDLYCLIDYSEDKRFQETKKCPSKILPLFTENLIHIPSSREECGTSPNHDLYHFGFNYCRITDNIQDMTGSPIISQVLSMYDICFDTHKARPFWTRHRIRTGFMLKDPLGLPSQRLENESEFSTEGFKSTLSLWAENVFQKQAEEYAKQEPNAPDKMIPQQLVPHEDIALKVWKKTTMHMANTAPLWEQLVPVMKSINDGIRRAAIKVNLDSYNPQTNSYDNLKIYTTTYSHLSWGQRVINWFKFYKKSSFGWNVWCKFVHYESENKGIMIFLHNLPGNPPEITNPAIDNSQGDQDKQTDSDGDSNKPVQSSKKNETTDAEMKKLLREKECTKTVTCDFESWFVEQPEQSYRHDLFSYAYCCEVDKKKIEKNFAIKLTNDITLLDINNMIVKNPQTDNNSDLIDT